jgi:iron complex outermembrane receptor protein
MPRAARSRTRFACAFALAWLWTPLGALEVPPTPPAPASHPPPSDPRHRPVDAHGEVVDLDTVRVTASPLQDPASALARPVDVLAGARLDEARAASLGETVSGLPGVQSSNFGPAVGRPVIRGMDGPRVAVLSGGLASQDVSTVSQDHAPAVEPFLADQIEVLKGPSTLLYGSGAIGGVVNVVDGRIPQDAMDGVSGRVEARRFGGSQDGSTDMARIDGGNDRFAFHADAVYRNAKDYDTPAGRQANSFIDTRSGALGGSLLGDWGFVGLSAARFEDSYGNPGEPGDIESGERGVHLRMRQDRYDLKGGLTHPWGEGSGLRFSLAHTGYDHVEFEGDKPGTTFAKDATEGRIEASWAREGGWNAAMGLQGSSSRFAANGEEAFVPPTDSRAQGLFGIARRGWGPFQLDLGARIDALSREPENGRERDFKPLSLSVGGTWKPFDAWRLSARFDRAERAPAEEELFANGPHIATLAYEIGDSSLGKESANQVELGLHFDAERFHAVIAAYRNRFQDFIYLADTGERWFWDEEGDYLPIRQWTQAGATFRGFEAELIVHLSDAWDLRTFADRVRATLIDGGNVPRIAPSRLGAQLRWESGGWRASLGATRYTRQDDVAVEEMPTPGYTLVDAHLARHFDTLAAGWELFLDGNNLANQTAHVHTSFLKDVVALPGRSVSAGVRVYF